MNKLLVGASVIAIASSVSSAAYAQLDEIIVTATKRAENAQDIPVAVQALGQRALDELGVDVFTDYLLQLPGVTAGGSGPGQGTIYIRGLASTTPNLTTAGVAGLAPNVALYLDEQPVTQVGRNLDVYAADLSRVEVLPGPQGTLFGASSQAGTIRLITNKADTGEFFATMNTGVSFTEHGSMSEKVEAVVNLPIIEDKFAVRGVFYIDNQGGYIDNVAGTVSARESARFQGVTTRSNGVPTNPGFQAGADFSGVTFLDANNLDLVENNFNDTTYTGFRVATTYIINDDWKLSATHARQKIETEGVFFYDPELNDPNQLSVQRFSPDETNDKFNNTSWTLEGRMGALDVVYTGAYLDRDVNQTVDYTDYLFVGQYLPYYICDGSVTYPGGAPSGTCQAPNLFVDSTTETEVFTHELRFTTPSEKRLRLTAGGFYSDQKLVERNNFTYPGSIFAESFTPGVFGWPQNGPLPGSSVSDPNPRPLGVIFFNDITRDDVQLGGFGEVTYDVIPDVLSITGGARYHDVRVSLKGSANSSFFNFGGVDVNAFGTNLDTQFDGTQVINGVVVPKKAVATGTVLKGNISWTPSSDILLYATYSEGFRPGLPNRPAGAGGGAVPAIVRTDTVKNYELGWKMDLADGQVRLNGSAFFVDIGDLQTTIFDTSVSNLLFSDNAADAEITGVEADLTWAPADIGGLTVVAGVSILDTKITKLVGASVAIAGPGEDLAYAPSFQGNLRARYEWTMENGFDAHIQPSMSYSASSFSDIVSINRAKQDSYFLLGLTAGIAHDRWSIELYGDNLTDERAQLNNNFGFDRERISVNRPRTWGMRMSVDY